MFNVISVGRPHWRKGYDYAIDAFKLLKDQNVKFTYTIVGGLNLELKYQIAELGLKNDTIIIDYVPFDEVKRLIKASDLVLSPSVEAGVSNVVLEAMAIRKLVLTTKFGGMEEVVNDGENGFVIPIRNVEAMAKKMMDISKISEEEKHKITTRAFETMQQDFNEKLMTTGLIDLYKDL